MSARLAVLISGNGSNLQAIIDAVRMRVLPAEIVVVVSNRKDAFGLERAAKAGHPDPVSPAQALQRRRPQPPGVRRRPGRACCARTTPTGSCWPAGCTSSATSFCATSPTVSSTCTRRCPASSPARHAIAEALAAYQAGQIKHTGCMVHLVPDEAVDAARSSARSTCPSIPTDTEETLAQRMHQAEHTLLIQSLLRLVEGDEEIDDEGDED